MGEVLGQVEVRASRHEAEGVGLECSQGTEA